MSGLTPIDPARILRRFHRGVLRVADDVRDVRFVVDQLTGFPVLPVRADVFAAEDLILFIPDEAEDALQLLVEATELDPNREAACDRFIAYHGAAQGVEGRARSARWARLTVTTAKIAGVVDDGACSSNAIGDDEPALCKWLNTTLGAASRIVKGLSSTPEDDLTVVGVDQFGVDVRARADIVRVEFPTQATSAAAARRMIEAIIKRT